MMETVVDGSLQRMKLDRLDLLQLHWCVDTRRWYPLPLLTNALQGTELC